MLGILGVVLLSRAGLLTDTSAPNCCLPAVSEKPSGLEDLRALAPVLSVFGLPVSTSVDVGAFSCGFICPLLKPQRLVTLNVLP